MQLPTVSTGERIFAPCRFLLAKSQHVCCPIQSLSFGADKAALIEHILHPISGGGGKQQLDSQQEVICTGVPRYPWGSIPSPTVDAFEMGRGRFYFFPLTVAKVLDFQAALPATCSPFPIFCVPQNKPRCFSSRSCCALGSAWIWGGLGKDCRRLREVPASLEKQHFRCDKGKKNVNLPLSV